MQVCPFCGYQIEEKIRQCPRCQEDMSQPSHESGVETQNTISPTIKLLSHLISIAIVLFVFSWFFGFNPFFKAKDQLDAELRRAVFANRPDDIAGLVKQGANLEVEWSEGKTPIVYAVEEGQTKLVKALVANGANVTVRFRDSYSIGNSSLLHEAVRRRYLDIAKCLVEAGVPVYWQNDEGYAPLHIAIENGDVEAVKFLLPLDQYSLKWKTKDGVNAEWLALQRQDYRILQAIRDYTEN